MEGETEKWYFEHLQKLINANERIPFTAKFNIKINKSITSSAKSITAIYKNTPAFHICDYESNEQVHIEQFEQILKELKDVKNINKNINYKLGYSNFAFDLWIILHKKQQLGSISHRKQYVQGINLAYKENFQFIEDYKEEKIFKRILSQISLDDVIRAVKNGDEMRRKNEENSQDKCRLYGNFKYYTENPDMTINECVRQILEECEIIKK